MSTRPACLLVEVVSHRCAVPVAATIETLRPLPLERLPGAPRGILGVSIIRGATVPVVDMAALFDEPEGSASRWVLVRAGERRLGLAVSRLIGVCEIDEAAEVLGPAGAALVAAPFVTAVATHAGRLLAVLDVARILPEARAGALAGARVIEHG
jgi:purine-binding chemotaxis protein CheW